MPTSDACWQLNSVTSTSWDLSTLVSRAGYQRHQRALTGQGDLAAKNAAGCLLERIWFANRCATESGRIDDMEQSATKPKQKCRASKRRKFQGHALAKPGAVLEPAAVGKHL